MTPSRLDELLNRLPSVSIAVFGDFFLDKYLILDPDLTETSIETGLPAHQVIETRCQPGAAGTVTNNLRALGVGTVEAVGFRGADGDGYELRRALRRSGVSTTTLLDTDERCTPCYCKPLVCREGQPPEELSRLDTKNRTRTSTELEDRVSEALEIAAARCQAIIVADQVPEPDCGVVTARLREFISQLAQVAPELVIMVDSRCNIGAFRGVSIKPNGHEVVAAFGDEPVEALATRLATECARPVFITQGEDGVVVGHEGQSSRVPAITVDGPIDIVGAGDSFCAASTAALTAGASPVEAAQMGCLVASITVQQLGTTGTASPDQVRARLLESPYVQ
ncbi:MAG: carbohydrate kinase [Armatimonadetes bacterium]|nr:carbohydrate kinase [Armatimonadota bacterium]